MTNKYEQVELNFNNENISDDKLKKKNENFIFSYSKMALYKECPLKYKFKYIDKMPEKPKTYFSFGQSIHSALEFFHSRVPPPSYDELINFFMVKWKEKTYIEKGYSDEERELSDLEKAKLILKKYWDKHKYETKIPFLCEYNTFVDVDGIRVVIIADKIEYLGQGKIKVIDYKTGKEGKRTSDQLYMYQKILELDRTLIEKVAEKLKDRVKNIEVDNMVYYYVENLKEVSFKRASSIEIGKFWEEALKIVDDINSEKFDPTPGEMQCNYCDFKFNCPVFSNNLKTRNNGLKEKVYKYIEISQKIEELKNKLSLIENELSSYFKNGIFSYEDENYKLELKKIPKIEFSDKEKILNLLKEEGLYEKTLRPTIASVLQILDDENIDEKVKRRIKEFSINKYNIVSNILDKNEK